VILNDKKAKRNSMDSALLLSRFSVSL